MKQHSLIYQKFQEAKKKFNSKIRDTEGNKILEKVIKIINDLGANWNTYDGGELAERQIKLAGYVFYLSDYIADLERISEQLKLELKNIRAKRWNEIAETIKAEHGKVQNKDQIENVLVIETKDIATEQILYETLYHNNKMKLQALRDIITALVQNIAQKKKDYELSKISQ